MSSYDEDAYDEEYDEAGAGSGSDAPPVDAPPTSFGLPPHVTRIVVEVGLAQALEEGTLQEYHDVLAVAHDTEGRSIAVVDSATPSSRVYDSGAVSHPKALVAPGEEDELTWEGVLVDLAKLGSEVESLAFLLVTTRDAGADGSEPGLGAQSLYARILDRSDLTAPYASLPVLASFTRALDDELRANWVMHLTRAVVPGAAAARRAGGEDGNDETDGVLDNGSDQRRSGSIAARVASPSAARALTSPAVANVATDESDAALQVPAQTVPADWIAEFISRPLAAESEPGDTEQANWVAELEAAVVERQASRPLRSVSLVPMRRVRVPRVPEALSVEVTWTMRDPDAYPLFPLADAIGAGAGAGAGAAAGVGAGSPRGSGGVASPGGSDYSSKRSGAGGGDDDAYDEDDEDGEKAKRAAELAKAEVALGKAVQLVALVTDAQGRPLATIPFGVSARADDPVAHKPSRRLASGAFVATAQVDLSKVPDNATGVSFALVDLGRALADVAMVSLRLLDVTGLDLDAILAPPSDEPELGDDLSETSSAQRAPISKSASKVSGGSSRRGSDRSSQAELSSIKSSEAIGSRRSHSEAPPVPGSKTASTSGSQKGLAKSSSIVPRGAQLTPVEEPVVAPPPPLPVEPANVGRELARLVLSLAGPSASAQDVDDEPVPNSRAAAAAAAAAAPAAAAAHVAKRCGVALPTTPPLSPRAAAALGPEFELASAAAAAQAQAAANAAAAAAAFAAASAATSAAAPAAAAALAAGAGSTHGAGSAVSTLPTAAQILMRLERTPAVVNADGDVVADATWTLLPLGDRLQCSGTLASVARALERSIQEVIPRFTRELAVGAPFRLRDYKDGWEFTNVVVGLSWADEAGPVTDMPIHAGCMLLDARGTELATISLTRKESTDGAVVHLVTDQLREQEARLRAASAAAAAARKQDDDSASDHDYSASGDAPRHGEAGGAGDEAGALGALGDDVDVEKLAIDLPKLSDRVRALVFVVGSTEADVAMPGLDLTLRVLDQTKALAEGKPESIGVGFEAARYTFQSEDGHTSVVVGVMTRAPATGRWQLMPTQQSYDGLSFADVLVDIENNFRAGVAKTPLVMPDVVRTAMPRALVPLAVYDREPFARTLALVKPDAVRAGAVPTILRELRLHGFEVLARERMRLTLPQASAFYAEHREKAFFAGLVNMMASGPIEALVLARAGAVGAWRALLTARVRPMFAVDATRNAVHGSSDADAALSEIRFFFPKMLVEVPTPARGVEYVEASVAPTLQRGLTALAKAKPADPIRWLARWLLANNPNKPRVDEPDA